MDTHGIPNGEKGAFACSDEKYLQDGLTKREYFAGLAMQGLMSNLSAIRKEGFRDSEISIFAVMQADELLKQLKEQ